MKPIVWTAHAREVQAARPITDAEIELVAREPQWTVADPDPQVERRFRVLPEREGRVLRVACVETAAHIRIVTFMLDRKARREPRP